MLIVGFREDMPASTIGREIEFLGACRIGGGFDRSSARIGNWPGRQTVDNIGVVWSGLFLLGLGNRMTERTPARNKTVNDRRIRLQLHLLLQAIDKDRGDTR